jgi:predicted phosphodiesterase
METEVKLPLSLAEPFCYDIEQKGNTFVLIGDIHSCTDEYEELLDKVVGIYGLQNTRIILLGDLVDRGPNNLYAATGLAYDHCIIGNHDRKLVRFCCGAKIEAHGEQAWFADLNDDHKSDIIAEFAEMPTAIRIKLDNGKFVTACHGGTPPVLYGEPFEVGRKWRLKGKEAATCYFGHTTGRKDAETGYEERLHKPVPVENFISTYGHIAYVRNEGQWIINDEPGTSVYLDHGGVFGGHLTAMIILPSGETEYVSVRCPEYSHGRRGDFSSQQ